MQEMIKKLLLVVALMLAMLLALVHGLAALYGRIVINGMVEPRMRLLEAATALAAVVLANIILLRLGKGDSGG